MPADVTAWPSQQSWFVPLRGRMMRLWTVVRGSWPRLTPVNVGQDRGPDADNR